jgi:hypothetical protein
MKKETLNGLFNNTSDSLQKQHDMVIDPRNWIIPPLKKTDNVPTQIFKGFARPIVGIPNVYFNAPVITVLTMAAELGAKVTGGRKFKKI